MSITDKEQIRHEVWLRRLLAEILDDKILLNNIFFKGGTCARMLGFLDRFSVDLDFDLSEKANKEELRKKLHLIFKNLNLEVKDEGKKALQFFLKYPLENNLKGRNTIKLEILDKVYKSNEYAPFFIPGVNRTAICQTVETMFAHRLIAPISRTENQGRVAGRDIYDIHHFFLQGQSYEEDVILERRGIPTLDYLIELREFIDKRVTKKTIDEDLNTLLDYNKFNTIRKYLKKETIDFINKEIERIKGV